MNNLIKENKDRLVEMYATNENGFADDLDQLMQVLYEGNAIDKSAFCQITLNQVDQLNKDNLRDRIFNATNPYGKII